MARRPKNSSGGMVCPRLAAVTPGSARTLRARPYRSSSPSRRSIPERPGPWRPAARRPAAPQDSPRVPAAWWRSRSRRRPAIPARVRSAPR
jgi:hypothetical protein